MFVCIYVCGNVVDHYCMRMDIYVTTIMKTHIYNQTLKHMMFCSDEPLGDKPQSRGPAEDPDITSQRESQWS